MHRRWTVAVAVGLAVLAGCGTIEANLRAIEARHPGAARATFDAPVNRVVVAAHDAAGPDLAFEDFSDFDFPKAMVRSDRGVRAMKDAVVPRGGTFEVELDIDDVALGSGRMVGKTKDDRPVTLWLLEREDGRKTEASLLIGKHGDPAPSAAYLARVAEKLAHPNPRPPARVKAETEAESKAKSEADAKPAGPATDAGGAGR